MEHRKPLSAQWYIALIAIASTLFGAGCPWIQTRTLEKDVLSSSFTDQDKEGWFQRNMKQVVLAGVKTEPPHIQSCVQPNQTSYQHATCVYPHFAKAKQNKRIGIIHQLAILEKKGLAVLHVLLNSTKPAYKLTLGEHLLAYASHYSMITPSFLASYYGNSKAYFLRSLSQLPQRERLTIVRSLVASLRLSSKKAVSKEFQGYIHLPAMWLWKQIMEESKLEQALIKWRITDCTRGAKPVTPYYFRSFALLQRYYDLWKKIKYTVRRSNVKNYVIAIRALVNGKTFVTIPPMDQDALQKAHQLIHAQKALQTRLWVTLHKVKNKTLRMQLLGWYLQIQRRSRRYYALPPL